jgi:hypothetical protein
VTGPGSGAGRRYFAVWRERNGQDLDPRATPISARAAALAEPVLARLIARRQLGDHRHHSRVLLQGVLDLGHVDLLAGHGPGLPDDGCEPEQTEGRAPGPAPVADPPTKTVRVMASQCNTCIYNKDVRRILGDSIPALIGQARGRGGHVVCHESGLEYQAMSIEGIPGAICSGYASQYPDTVALRAARLLGRIQYIDPPPPPNPHPDRQPRPARRPAPAAGPSTTEGTS